MDNEAAVGKRFAEDVENHTLRVLHDDGLYRHLMVRNKDSFIYWYEIITSPGQLTIRGDMGTYVFARLNDMFEFFGPGPRINTRYWSEKLLASSTPIQRYSPEVAVKQVTETLDELIESHDFDEDYGDNSIEDRPAAIRQTVKDEVLAFAENEQEFRHALEYYASFGIRFYDTWEWELREYDSHYLWNLHAIVWAIKQYRDAAATDPAASN